MTTEAYEAWVIHKIPSGDSSTRVTFFTREKGILNCLCKGGRTPKKQAILQPFLALWLAVDMRKDYHFTRHIEVLTSTAALKNNSLFAGLYVNELVYYALKPMDPQPELFAVYLNTMQGLAVISDRLGIEILLRRFERALLDACGHSPSFTHTANSASINPELCYQFIAGEGFVAADTGIAGADILALAEGRIDQLTVLKTAKFIMRQAIDHLLEGRALKSRLLYPRTRTR